MRLDQMESPVCTHDGVLHRVPRHKMVVPGFIRARMAIDMQAFMAERGVDCVLDADLIGLGWTKAQVEAHGRAAAGLARAQREDAEDGRIVGDPTATFTATEKAAVAGFYTLALGLMLAGLYGFVSQAIAAQSLGARIVLSWVL